MNYYFTTIILSLVNKKGNIIVFSISENKIKHKFNFYRKSINQLKNFLI